MPMPMPIPLPTLPRLDLLVQHVTSEKDMCACAGQERTPPIHQQTASADGTHNYRRQWCSRERNIQMAAENKDICIGKVGLYDIKK
eukprot:gene10-3407_t